MNLYINQQNHCATNIITFTALFTQLEHLTCTEICRQSRCHSMINKYNTNAICCIWWNITYDLEMFWFNVPSELTST